MTTMTDRSATNEAKAPPQPSRLLVADDEHLVATGLSSNLNELGYSVIGPASDGDEAIELCREQQPDLCLLDIRMPKKDGLAAAEVIFKQIGIPVVVLSAFSDPEYVDNANHIGVFGYMLKPVSLDQLRVNISLAWGRYLDHCKQDGEISKLKQRLEDRKTIEQAKWLIVQRKGIGEPEAMRTLQKHARNNRKTLIDVANSVLENQDIFDGDRK